MTGLVGLPVSALYARPYVTMHRQTALRLVLAAVLGAVTSGLIVGLVMRNRTADGAIDDSDDRKASPSPSHASCPGTLDNGSLSHLESYSQYGLPADGRFYAGHAARVMCAKGTMDLGARSR